MGKLTISIPFFYVKTRPATYLDLPLAARDRSVPRRSVWNFSSNWSNLRRRHDTVGDENGHRNSLWKSMSQEMCGQLKVSMLVSVSKTIKNHAYFDGLDISRPPIYGKLGDGWPLLFPALIQPCPVYEAFLGHGKNPSQKMGIIPLGEIHLYWEWFMIRKSHVVGKLLVAPNRSPWKIGNMNSHSSKSLPPNQWIVGKSHYTCSENMPLVHQWQVTAYSKRTLWMWEDWPPFLHWLATEQNMWSYFTMVTPKNAIRTVGVSNDLTWQ